MTFIIYLGMMAFVATLAVGLAVWASQGGVARRSVVTLILACVGSYAAGFLVDLLTSTIAGELPSANIIAPAASWLLIALVCGFAALVSTGPPIMLALPYAANAALAFTATAVRTRHFAVAIVLTVLAVLLFLVGRWRNQAVARARAPSAA